MAINKNMTVEEIKKLAKTAANKKAAYDLWYVLYDESKKANKLSSTTDVRSALQAFMKSCTEAGIKLR